MTDFLQYGRTGPTSGHHAHRADSKPRKTRRIASERRRLTLGAIEPSPNIASNSKDSLSGGDSKDNSNLKIPSYNDSGGLINFLKNTPVANIVRTSGGPSGAPGSKKKISFSSVTAANENQMNNNNNNSQNQFSSNLNVGPGSRQQDSYSEKPTTNDMSDKSSSSPSGLNNTLNELNKLGIGITCRKGCKPESPNQDSYSLLYIEGELLLCGVYDGHGSKGHDISHFVKDLLPKLFLSDPNRVKVTLSLKTLLDPKQALTDSFSRCQRLIEHAEKTSGLQAGLSGTTCTLVYQPLCFKEKGNRKIYVAHCGDSRAALISKNININSNINSNNSSTSSLLDQYKGRNLTEDHKPSIPAEKRRIERNGGRVIFDGFYNHRVFVANRMYPGLNMSRALGDTTAHREAGLCAIPDIQEYVLNSNNPGKEEDVALIIASDGVWEFLDANQACKTVMAPILKSGESAVQVAVENLSKLSWDSWMADSDNEISDDITTMMVMINKVK